MICNRQRLSLWWFRLSLVCFALAWVLPVFPGSDGSLLRGAWAFFAAPFVAFGFWVTFLFGGFQPPMLMWAVLLTVTTTMNGALVFAPFHREEFAERPLLIAVSAGLSAVAATVLCHCPPGTEKWMPVWSVAELAWIASFVLMSASGVAGCLAGVPKSSFSRNTGNDDRSL